MTTNYHIQQRILAVDGTFRWIDICSGSYEEMNDRFQRFMQRAQPGMVIVLVKQETEILERYDTKRLQNPEDCVNNS